jgi:hypothetical protein
VQSCLPIEALCVNFGIFLQQEVDGGFASAVLQAAGDHEWGPARAVLDVRVEGFRVHEQLYNGEMIVGACPMDGEAGVIVSDLGDLCVCLQQEVRMGKLTKKQCGVEVTFRSDSTTLACRCQ